MWGSLLSDLSPNVCHQDVDKFGLIQNTNSHLEGMQEVLVFVVKQQFLSKQAGIAASNWKKAVVDFFGSCSCIFFPEELKKFDIISTRWARELPLFSMVENRKDEANKAACCRQSVVTEDVCALIARKVAFPLRLASGVKGFQEKPLFKHL